MFNKFNKTKDGFEKTFQINYLAPFFLTNLLLPKLLDAKGVVINTSSHANIYGHINISDLNNQHKFHYRAYGTSKLEDLLMIKELHRKYHRKGLSAVAYHPGVVSTNVMISNLFLNRLEGNIFNLFKPFLTSSKKAGKLLDWFITGTPDVTWVSGRYYDKYKLTSKVNSQAKDLDLQKQLWDKSLKLVGLNK